MSASSTRVPFDLPFALSEKHLLCLSSHLPYTLLDRHPVLDHVPRDRLHAQAKGHVSSTFLPLCLMLGTHDGP